MAETEMVEMVAKACREAVALDRGRSVPFEEMSYIVARAAIEAMRREHTLEMQIAGMEALCLYNIEKDGPAKPHEECKTPDDWMERGANIAGRMQSGEGVSRVLNAMIDAALSPPGKD